MRLLHFATALRMTPLPPLRIRRLVWPKGTFRPVTTARMAACPPRFGVRCYLTLSNEIQNHWLICIPLSLVNSHLFGSARSRSRARSGEADP